MDARGDRQYVYLRLQHLENDHIEQPVTGLVRLNVHATSLPFLPGDVVRVTRLRLRQVRGSHNPGGFDFERFMRWQGIYVVGGVSNPERLSLQHRPEGFRLDRALEQWRQYLRAEVRTLLSAPYDAVFLAMVLGQRGDLTPAVQQSFRASGTTHLLVVSGLNVSCIAIGVFWVWRTLLRLVRSWLPRSWYPGWRPTPIAAVLSMPPVLLYCSLVGWEVPASRAALMVGCALLALMVQRRREPLHALVLAAALILVLEPAASRDIAFQLSFVAVASIFVVSDTALEYSGSAIRRWGKRLWLYMLVNSAAYLGTLPILGSTFHTVPTFAILANLPLVPLAGVLTQAGVAALGVLVLWPAIAPWVFVPFVPVARLDRDDCRDRRSMAGSPTLSRLPFAAYAARVLWTVWESAALASLAPVSAVCRIVQWAAPGRSGLAISGDTYPATPRDIFRCRCRRRHCRPGAWASHPPH